MSKKPSYKAAGSPSPASHPNADERFAATLEALVPLGETLLELTAGGHTGFNILAPLGCAVVEHPLRPAQEAGADQWQAVTEALDDRLLSRTDRVLALVPWSAIVNADALLARLSAAGCDLLCLAEDAEPFVAHGFDLVDRQKTADGLSILRLDRRHRRRDVIQLPAPRPTIIVSGFYGRGNCGDEALFQSIYETLSPDYDIVVAVDEFGALEGYRNWYPYDRCEIRHHWDFDVFEEDREIVAVMIGGGGLAIGFAAHLVFEARARGIPAIISGVDLPALDMPGCDPPDRVVVRGSGVVDRAQQKAYLSGFAQVMVRSRKSYEICRKLEVPARHGSDWAIRLTQDAAEDVLPDDRRVLVVLREFPLHLVPFDYVLAIETLIDGLNAQGWHPEFLPFCPEDARNTADLDLARLAPTQEHWWNPRRVKQLIAASGLVVSVGRLHPLIFAASVGIPAVSLVPPLALPSGRASIAKIDAVCADWGLDQFKTVEELLEATAVPIAGVSARKLATATARLDRSIHDLKTLIAAHERRRWRDVFEG